MDKFSKSIHDQISFNFPQLICNYNTETPFLELEIPTMNNSKLGGLVIQTTEDKDIWIRNHHPCSAYLVTTIEELITIIKGVLSNKILWVIAFKHEEWVETTLTYEDADVDTEEGETYTVLSWSGTSDRTFKVE